MTPYSLVVLCVSVSQSMYCPELHCIWRQNVSMKSWYWPSRSENEVKTILGLFTCKFAFSHAATLDHERHCMLSELRRLPSPALPLSTPAIHKRHYMLSKLRSLPSPALPLSTPVIRRNVADFSFFTINLTYFSQVVAVSIFIMFHANTRNAKAVVSDFYYLTSIVPTSLKP
jgi:hypothetical protein